MDLSSRPGTTRTPSARRALAALAVEGAKQADAMTGTLDSQIYGVAHHEDFPLR